MLVSQALSEYLIANLADEISRYKWNEKAARWIDNKTGRFVSQARVVNALNGYNADVEQKFIALTNRMINGDLLLPDWQTKIAEEMKKAYTVNLLFGRGGKNAVTQSDWGSMGAKLKQEYNYLNRFASEIKAGKLTAKEILSRVALYARGAISWFWNGRVLALVVAGYKEERRVLHPAEHCVDCVAYAGQGWVPIGTLPPPGIASRCMHNCKCTKEFRKRQKKVRR